MCEAVYVIIVVRGNTQINNKGLRQCTKLQELGEVVIVTVIVVVPGQKQSPILLCRLHTKL